MKKILYFAFIGICLCGIVACEKEFENPGDFSLKATLGFNPASALSKVDGITYEFKVLSEKDTAFESSYTLNDTTFDANGEPMIGPDGKIVINNPDRGRYRMSESLFNFYYCGVSITNGVPERLPEEGE